MFISKKERLYYLTQFRLVTMIIAKILKLLIVLKRFIFLGLGNKIPLNFENTEIYNKKQYESILSRSKINDISKYYSL